MTRTITKITSDLNLLSPRDFNSRNVRADGLKRLSLLTKELAEIDEPEKIKEILFLAIERLSNSDELDPRFELGNPGPFVHTLEKLPNYSIQLIESIKRYPTPLTVWVINRILNIITNDEEKQFWFNLLQEVIDHPQATSFVKEEAQSFIDIQTRQTNKDVLE